MKNNSKWTARDTSAANTAKTVTKTCPSNQRLVLTSYLVVIRGAAAGADIGVAIKDVNDVVLWQDYIGSGAARGERCGFSWPEGLDVVDANGNPSNVKIVVDAGGSGVIAEINLKGRYE